MKPILQTFNGSDKVWEPLYRLEVQPDRLERELFQSTPVRRLKHLHHYGAGALISPITHSRFEHTVGVWSLTKYFFPEWRELHTAAILHDIGHLPFSHSVEHALGQNHHHCTELAIASGEVASILQTHGLPPQHIIDLLNQDTPLTHRSDKLGIDHLDSFMRDTYAAGIYQKHPSELIPNIRFDGNYIETDEETAVHLLDAVVNDNRIFLNPYFLAADELLSQAVKLYCEQTTVLPESVVRMSDYELLAELETAESADVRRMLQVLLREPHRMVLCDPDAAEAFQAEIRKIYNKQPLVGHVPISNLRPDCKAKIDELESLCGTYYFTIHDATISG